MPRAMAAWLWRLGFVYGGCDVKRPCDCRPTSFAPLRHYQVRALTLATCPNRRPTDSTMGGTSSRPATPEERALNEQERRERENRNILLRKGVLIPPSFGLGTDIPPPSATTASSTTTTCSLGVSCSAPHLAVSSHVLGLGPLTSSGGDVISSLLARSAPHRLLSSEHLLSGLFVSASTPTGLANATAGWANGAGNGFLSGAVLLPSHSSPTLSGLAGSVSTTSSASADLAGHVGGFLSRPLGCDGNRGQLTAYGLLAGSEAGIGSVGDASSPPHQPQSSESLDRLAMGKIGWSYSHQLLSDQSKRSESWPSEGYYKNDPFANKDPKQSSRAKSCTLVGIGSALTFSPSFSGGGVEAKEASSHVSVSSPSNGFEGAVQASLPINSLMLADKSSSTESQFQSRAIMESLRASKPQISGYISFDLNGVDGSSELEQGPPIMVTLHQLKGDRNSESAATVSQTFTFDRIVTNPLEDRCPKIRNTVSWAVRLRRSVNRNLGYEPDEAGGRGGGGLNTGATAVTSLTAGVSYQINRGLCYKVNADSRDGVTVGILLKRWAHPRITASALVGTGPVVGGSKAGSVGFKGICLQIESGPLPSSAPTSIPGTVPANQFVNGDWLYGLAGGGNATVSGETPETKAELPDR